MTIQEKFKRAAEVICKQGMMPFPVNDTTIAIVKNVVGENEDELDLIQAFNSKASQTTEELKDTSGFSEEQVTRCAVSLAKKGLVFNQPNSAGIMVFRLLPLMTVGVMEYKFMGPLTGDEEEKRLAELFQKLFEEVRDQIQGNYDHLIPVFKATPPVDRTVPARETESGKSIKILPVGKTIEVPDEFILPSQSVEEIIRKFDDIAVGHCFCRQRRKVLGEPCSTDAPTLNCFSFGKSARHTVAHGLPSLSPKTKPGKLCRKQKRRALSTRLSIPIPRNPGRKQASATAAKIVATP